MKRSALYIAASFALFLGGSTWLFAPVFNQLLTRGPNLISEYEAIGMPYGWLFRLFDFAAGALLLALLYRRRQTVHKAYGRVVTDASISNITVVTNIDAAAFRERFLEAMSQS